MANYKLGPVIGKLGGGADVQKIPVNIVADGKETTDIIHTVHAPEGETWLVALAGDLNPNVVSRSGPVLSIGEVSIGPELPRGRIGLAAEVTGTAEITIKRNDRSGNDTLVGQIYVIPLPD